MASVQERWVSNLGAHLYTRAQGHGFPLVCVHGGPGAGHEYLMPGLGGLSDEFRVVFYDQRNAGRSRSTSNASARLDVHLSDLEAVLDVQEIKRGVLVGHSWGAVLALLYAARFPERIAGVALLNSVSVDPTDRWDFAAAVVSRLESEEFERYCAELRAAGEGSSSVSLRDRLEFAHATWGLFHRTEHARSMPYFPVAPAKHESLWAEAAEALATAQRPALHLLVVQGEYDPTPMTTALRTARAFCSAPRVVSLPGCGHVAPLEARADLARAVRAFARERGDKFGMDLQLATHASG